jgi:hypothetical protein
MTTSFRRRANVTHNRSAREENNQTFESESSYAEVEVARSNRDARRAAKIARKREKEFLEDYE